MCEGYKGEGCGRGFTKWKMKVVSQTPTPTVTHGSGSDCNTEPKHLNCTTGHVYMPPVGILMGLYYR